METVNNKAAAVREYLGLNRNVAVLAVSIFGLGLGEELWQSFLPKYLAALGASGAAIGAFASSKDLLDGLYQFPGGWVNDRFGRRLWRVAAAHRRFCRQRGPGSDGREDGGD